MNKVVAFLLIFLSGCLVYGQKYRFSQYTTEDGISQNFIYSINQDNNGYLWVGTGEGLCKFDGKNFSTFNASSGLSEDVITCSHVDKKGNQWLGHNEGGISKLTSKKIIALETESLNQSKINAFASTNESVFFISQNNGLFQIKNDIIQSIGSFGLENFFSIACVDNKNIIIGTDEGVLHIKKEGQAWKKVGIHRQEMWFSSIAESNEPGIFLAGTKSNGLFKIRLNEGSVQFANWDGEKNLDNLDIQSIVEDQDNNLWLGTFGDGLIKIHVDTTGNLKNEYTFYNESTGLPSNFVKSVYQDREGNIWIGTFGAGLVTLIDDFFTFYSHDPEIYGNNVMSISIDQEDKWYGVENGLIRRSPNLEKGFEFYNSKNGLADDYVTTLFNKDSILWIGTNTSGVYFFDYKTEKIKQLSIPYGSLQNRINQIVVDHSRVWIASEGGLIVYDIENESLNLFDTEMGLAHNAIKSVCVASDGKVWMGTHSRFIYSLHNSSIQDYEITDSRELEIISITERSNGEIWFATSENGIYKKDGREFIHYGTMDGLKSNYCYAIHEDSKNNIWVGHRGAISRLNSLTQKITVYDHKSGINAQVNPNAMFLDYANYLWIGTDAGSIKYDPTKDKEKMVAPVTNLLQVKIGDQIYDVDEEISLPYNNYRIEFEFIGVSFKNPENVTYKFQLEGYDDIYSNPTKELSATYGRIADGEYTFNVIACNGEDNCSEIPAKIKINIAAPFWKTWWFYLIVVISLSALVFLIIQNRVRRFKAQQIYLEEQLEIKTKEVVEKADKIEEINKDLTASINYAERIQSSILPKQELLSEYYPGSFIFFRPRDVVSGDFYFIREYDDKLIVACCDCTGHGVPGAFMSMIGSTTLRNIYKLMESTGVWLTPEKVLEKLDEEIQKILHQKTELSAEDDFFRSRDGMDMTLCEINTKTNHVLLSAAKRHSFVEQNGAIEIISGDKRAIGGGEVDQVPFTVREYNMKRGEAIYLFSDGYPDQFGGPDGRKLKLAGTRKIIEGLQTKDKLKYGDSVGNNFDLWQSDFDQIDDVLFMGLLF